MKRKQGFLDLSDVEALLSVFPLPRKILAIVMMRSCTANEALIGR